MGQLCIPYRGSPRFTIFKCPACVSYSTSFNFSVVDFLQPILGPSCTIHLQLFPSSSHGLAEQSVYATTGVLFSPLLVFRIVSFKVTYQKLSPGGVDTCSLTVIPSPKEASPTKCSRPPISGSSLSTTNVAVRIYLERQA